MRRWFVLGLVVLALAIPVLAGNRDFTARVYIPQEWWRQESLLQLLNETDVVYVETFQYLDAVMGEEQLNKIAALGLKTEILPIPPEVNMTFGYFFKYAQVRDTMRAWTTRYPTICRLDSAGPFYDSTAARRRIYFLTVANPLTGNTKPEAFFNGATHAREPLGQEAARRYAMWLLQNYGTDSLATWIVNNRQTHFAPVMNPDGYVYNETYSDIYGWRKNRHFISSVDWSVDVNRNYGYKWGYDNNGSSGTRGNETYRGPSRFSELETQKIRDFFNGHKLRTGCDFHTYGHYNMCPWGYSNTVHLPDSLIYFEILDTVNTNNGYGTSRTGQIGRTLYAVNGSSVEWEFADTLRDDNHLQKFIEHAITIEMATTGFWQGNNDSNYIRTEVNLNMPGMKYQTKVAGVYFYRRNLYVDDTTTSNGNRTGRLDPGEIANLWMTVRNHAVSVVDSAVNITAVIRSLDTAIVVTTPNGNFGKILRVSTGDNRTAKFQVRCSRGAPQGSWKKFRVEMTYLDDGNTIMQPMVDSVQIGNTPVAVAEIPSPDEMVPFTLSPMRPNPMRATGTVRYSLTTEGKVSLVVYNALGQSVRTLVNGNASAGHHVIAWDGRDDSGRPVAPGAYFLRYKANGQEALGRVVVVR
jgi:hypothetical protein